MPKPKADETREEWMARCIPVVIDDETASDGEQAVAICSSMWESEKTRTGEQTMKRERRTLTMRLMAGGELRTAVFEKRDHLVVPVVMLQEGVIHAVNAETPELVLAKDLAQFAVAWSGEPVLWNHPVVDGQRVSANSPAVLEEFRIGRLFNARMDGTKLKADAWIDLTLAAELGSYAQSVVERLQAGEMVEVSIGAFIVAEKARGVFGGKPYLAIWRDIAPDHLAMLPDGKTGACSNEMGCGAPRAAAKRDGAEGLSDFDVRDLIRDALFADEGDVEWLYVEAVFEKTVVYSLRGGNDSEQFFERGYTLTDDETIALAAEKKPVKRVVRYEPEDSRAAESSGESGGDPLPRFESGGLIGRDDGESPIPVARENARDEMKPATLREKFGSAIQFLFRNSQGEDELSDSELRSKLDRALFESEPAYMGIEEVFPSESTVVYAVLMEDAPKWFSRTYALSDDGVTFEDAVEVVPRTRFEPVDAEESASCDCSDLVAKKGDETPGDITMEKKERIAALIASESTPFTEADQSKLEALCEFTLAALEATMKPVEEVKPTETPAPVVVHDEDDETPVVEEEQTVESYLASAPAEIREMWEERQAEKTEKKSALVELLVEAQEHFDEAALQSKSLDELEDIRALVAKPTADFSAIPLPRTLDRGSDDSVPAAPSLVKTLQEKAS